MWADDTILASDDREDMINNLIKLIEIFNLTNFKIEFDKCGFLAINGDDSDKANISTIFNPIIPICHSDKFKYLGTSFVEKIV